MRAMAYALTGTYLAAITAIAAEPQALTGRFEGTGRACYGTLAIKSEAISWRTPFSQWNATAFELIERDKKDGKTRLAYRFKAPAPSCRYAILTLTHTGAVPETGWEATGYGSQ